MSNSVERLPSGGYKILGISENVIRCTELLKTFHNEFDPDEILKNKTKEESELLLSEWSEVGKLASEQGTELHLQIEEYLLYKIIPKSNICFEYFLNFLNDNPTLITYKIEWMVTEPWLLIAGTIDVVFKDTISGNFILVDWKRSKCVKHESFQNEVCKYPLYHLYDCNFTKYALQLNLYRWILNKVYHISINDMYLVVLYPDNPNYIQKRVPIMDKEIEYIIQYRIQDLTHKGYAKNAFEGYTFTYNIRDVKKNSNHKRLLKTK